MEAGSMATFVREARLEDNEVVVSLIRELGEMDGNKTVLSAEDVKHFLEVPGNMILLTEVDGQVVGLLSYTVSLDLWHAGDCCLIRELIIRARNRQQGLGGLLLQEVFRRAESNNWTEVSVSTRADNLPAIALYKKHGMTDEAMLLEWHFQTR
jgi:ribosomal protein S18 acetylase RimI-like enzyme